MMMKLFLILSLVIFVSCSTAKKTAQELANQGLHEAAIPKWLEAMKKSPDDVEVQVGLKRSQEIVLNERLVEIRDLRNSKRYDEAVVALNKLIVMQNEWKLPLDMNSSSFLGKELQLLWSHEKSNLKALANRGEVLGASLREKEISYIFNALPDYGEAKELIAKKGRAKCGELKKYIDFKVRPFYSNFVGRFCNYYESNLALSLFKEGVSDVLYSSISPKIEIKGLDENLTGEVSKKIFDLFMTTPLYDPDSVKAIRLEVNGEWKVIPSIVIVPQVHTYKVKVPYLANVSVTKSRQIPYQVTESQCVDHSSGRSCRDVLVTKYKEEKYKDTKKVTRYREEDRIFNYNANKKSQELIMQLRGSLFIGNDMIPLTFSKLSTESKIQHDVYLPDIGLLPAKEDLTNPIVAFSNFADEASKKVAQELDNYWVRKYCSLSKSKGLASDAEAAIRCRKSPNHPKENLDSWFMKSFGVTSDKAESLIGKF